VLPHRTVGITLHYVDSNQPLHLTTKHDAPIRVVNHVLRKVAGGALIDRAKRPTFDFYG
jgi:hypothetical protein